MRRVDVEIFNRTTYFTDTYAREKLSDYFRFRPNNYQWMPHYKSGAWDGYITLFQRGNKISTGAFLALKDQIEEERNVRFAITDFRERPKFRDADLSDRAYQNFCIRLMQRSKSGGIIKSATGSGKTLIAGLYLKSLIVNGCFIVDELTLMDQARRALKKVIGEEIGEIGDGWFAPARVTVATVQTLFLHKDNPKFIKWHQDLDVLFIDELHLMLNRRNNEVVKTMQPRVVFGLTATLELNKEGVRLPAFALCGPVLFEYNQEQGTKEGFLAPAIVCGVKVIQEGNGDKYHVEYDDLIVHSRVRNRAIIKLTEEAYERGKYTVILVERVAHLKLLSEKLAHIPHRVVYGAKKRVERVISKRKLDKGEIKLLICNRVFKKGVDIPSLDCIIEAAAYRSKNDAIQKFGRLKRMKIGKAGAVYFDINDRSPDGIRYRRYGWNRFERGARSRVKAFKARSIPVVFTEWNGNAGRIFDKAERTLGKFIRTLAV